MVTTSSGGGPSRQSAGERAAEALIPLGPGDTASLPALRAICRRVLAGWECPAHLACDVELVVSELATNALVHTQGPIRIRLVRRGRTLQLEVADTNSAAPAIASANPDDESVSGRGLFIAATLADRLHIERATDLAADSAVGKTMIAEFDLSADHACRGSCRGVTR